MGVIDIPSHTGRAGGVKYFDYAMGEFLHKASEKPWFKNTLFVIIADHCAGSAGQAELPFMEYQIPFIIYNPGLVRPQQIGKLCSQIDVAPTLLGVMNWSYKTKFFGKDIVKMAPEEERAFISNYQKLGYIKNNRLSILSPQQKVTHYKIDSQTGDMKVEIADPEIENEAIIYYQSANYVYKNKLNKWKLIMVVQILILRIFKYFIISIFIFLLATRVKAESKKDTLINVVWHDTVKIRKAQIFETDAATMLYTRPKPFQFAKNVPSDIYQLGKTAFLEEKICRNWGAILAGSALLVLVDQPVTDAAKQFGRYINLDPTRASKTLIEFNIGGFHVNAMEIPDNANSAIYYLGEGWASMLVAGGLYSYGLVANDYPRPSNDFSDS